MLDEETPVGGSITCVSCKRRTHVATRKDGWSFRSRVVEDPEGTRLAWDVYCPKCKDPVQDIKRIPRYLRKDYYCGHCDKDIPYEVYNAHVVSCLDKESQFKLRLTMDTASFKTPYQEGTVPVPASGFSRQETASTPNTPDSSTPRPGVS